MKFYKPLLTTILFLVANALFAQDTESEENLSLETSPIEGQFEYIYTKSGNYRADGVRYEVVKLVNLNKLQTNVLDSIGQAKKEITSLNATIAGHETTIGALNDELSKTKTSLAEVTESKDNISFLGIPLSKSTYNVIMWGIILGLLLLGLLFIYKFKNSNALTQEAKQSLAELEGEYEDHRRRALEREQKISRQLQDEINRLKKGK